jgi:hypothetical protein
VCGVEEEDRARSEVLFPLDWELCSVWHARPSTTNTTRIRILPSWPRKQLRIGLIGYGFMGRAHSNAYAQVGHFFPSNYDVVLQAVCGRDEKLQKPSPTNGDTSRSKPTGAS